MIQSNQYRHQIGQSARPDESIQSIIGDIESMVIKQGDAALIRLSQQFDGVSHMDSLVVPQSDVDHAFTQLSPSLLTALETAHGQIKTFHRHQLPTNWSHSPDDGVTYGMRYHPIQSVGIYVPGGRALYPSSVLMNAVPAQLAGVSSIVMTTPPQSNGHIHPVILVAAHLSGVHTIIKSGGAQAIFALAYGTESVPKVDKIVGPGNKYVDAAKKRVFGQVGIDKPAGPSEVAIWIDDSKWSHFAGWECLAQLEHDPDARAVVVAPNDMILRHVQDVLPELLRHCDRVAILKQSMVNIDWVVATDTDDGMDLLNQIASEHVVVLSDQAMALSERIYYAGTVFIGPYTPVAAGDYMAGPNHVLPTDRAARFSSALGVMDFMTSASTLHLNQMRLELMAPTIQELASLEGLDAHYKSVNARLGMGMSF